MTLVRASGDDANVILSRYATERLPPMTLADVIASIEAFLLPVLTQAWSAPTGNMRWAKGGPWLAS